MTVVGVVNEIICAGLDDLKTMRFQNAIGLLLDTVQIAGPLRKLFAGMYEISIALLTKYLGWAIIIVV